MTHKTAFSLVVSASLLIGCGGAGSQSPGTTEPSSAKVIGEDSKKAVREQEAAADAYEEKMGAETEQIDRMEKDLEKALKIALGKQAQTPGMPAPESSSVVLTELRKTPIKLRLEPVVDQDGKPVNDQFIQMKDSYTDRVQQLSRKIAEQKASKAEMKEVQDGAKHVMKLNDLRQNVLNVSMVTMTSNSQLQTSSMTTLLRVAGVIRTRKQMEMEMNAQDYARIAKWLQRERRVQAIAATSMGMLATYQAVLNQNGNPKALDALADASLSAMPFQTTATEEDAKAYVANIKGSASEVKAKYESMMRKVHGDAKYEARYKAGIDAMFKQVEGAESQKSAGEMVSESQAKYRADVGKCMKGEAVDPGSMVSPPQCKELAKAVKSGDTSALLPGTKKAFDENGGAPGTATVANAAKNAVGGLLGGLLGGGDPSKSSPLSALTDAALGSVPGLGTVKNSLEGIQAIAKGDPKAALGSAIGLVPGGSAVKGGLDLAAKLLFKA